MEKEADKLRRPASIYIRCIRNVNRFIQRVTKVCKRKKQLKLNNDIILVRVSNLETIPVLTRDKTRMETID